MATQYGRAYVAQKEANRLAQEKAAKSVPTLKAKLNTFKAVAPNIIIPSVGTVPSRGVTDTGVPYVPNSSGGVQKKSMTYTPANYNRAGGSSGVSSTSGQGVSKKSTFFDPLAKEEEPYYGTWYNEAGTQVGKDYKGKKYKSPEEAENAKYNVDELVAEATSGRTKLDDIVAEAQETNLTPENLLTNEYVETAQTAEDYGISPGLPKTAQEDVAAYKKRQEEDRAYLAQTQGRQAEIESIQAERTRRQAEGSAAGMEARMAQSPEGVVSSSAPLASATYRAEIGSRLDEYSRQRSLAEDSRKRAIVELQRAQQSGDQQLATQIKGKLAGFEMDILKAKNEELSLLNDASAEERATQSQKNANIKAFTDMVGLGTELTPEAVDNFAKTLGLPFSDAWSYYQGASAIRKEKSLTNEEKQVMIADKQKDLTDKINGVTTEAAKKIEYLKKLYQSGASKETTDAFMDMAGITREDDPKRQAEIKKLNAETKVAEALANGKLVNPLDILEYAKGTYEYNELTGGQQTYTVEGGTYEMLQSGNSVIVNVEDGTDLGDRGQCGAFVNDTIGKKLIPDDYEQKKDLITSKIPAAGMIFIQPAYGDYATYGHTGFVERVNDNGTVDVVESNRSAPNTVGRRTVSITEFDGFFAPPNAKITGGNANVPQNYTDALNKVTSKTPVSKTKEIRANFNQYIKDNDLAGAKEYLEGLAYDYRLTPAEKKDVGDFTNVSDEMTRISNQINTDTPSGVYAKMANDTRKWLNLENDSQYRDLFGQVQQAQASYRRALFGTAVTDSEMESGKLFLINNDDKVKDVIWKVQNMAVYSSRLTESIKKRALGDIDLEIGEYSMPDGEEPPIGGEEHDEYI